MRLSAVALVGCSLLAVAGSARAEAPAAMVPGEVIRYRETVMRALASQMKALAPIAARKVNYPKNAALHANAIADGSKIIGELFPKGSGPKSGETDALESIWKDGGKAWAQAAEKFRVDADKLQATAATGDLDALRAQLELTHDACAACHKSFRASR